MCLIMSSPHRRFCQFVQMPCRLRRWCAWCRRSRQGIRRISARQGFNARSRSCTIWLPSSAAWPTPTTTFFFTALAYSPTPILVMDNQYAIPCARSWFLVKSDCVLVHKVRPPPHGRAHMDHGAQLPDTASKAAQPDITQPMTDACNMDSLPPQYRQHPK
jgi:hypothetical protein